MLVGKFVHVASLNNRFMRFQMHGNFDGSRVSVLCPLRRVAGVMQLALACAIFIALTAAAQAYSVGPPPSDPHESYVAVRTGLGPGEDKFVRTRFDSELGGKHSYVLSATHNETNSHGAANGSARISEARFGDIYLNPDLHASVAGEAKIVGNLSGSIDAAANASFRDIIVIKKLPPFNSSYPFEIDFSIDGDIAGTGDSSSASRGWANVAINFSLYDLDNPNRRIGDGLSYSSLPAGEAPAGSLAGLNGHVESSVKMKLDVTEGTRLVFEGSIDMLGTSRYAYRS